MQRWYYIFQVVQVFLVTAVFSGAAAVASELIERARNPTSIPELLARQLPRALKVVLQIANTLQESVREQEKTSWTSKHSEACSA